jgi:hypothetical protein
MVALRSSQRLSDVWNLHPEYCFPEKLNFVIIPDLSIPRACDAVFQPAEFDYIIHAARKYRFDVKNVERDIVAPSPDP